MSVWRGKVLVLGHDTRCLIAILRSLGRKNIEVHIAGCSATSSALRSRFLTAVHNLPRFDPASDDWLRKLTALMDREAYDLVIPATDFMVLSCQLHAEELARHGQVYLLSPKLFDVVTDKAAIYEIAVRENISAPATVVVRKEKDTIEAAHFRFPVFVKPCCSVVAHKKGSKDYAVRIEDAGELSDYVQNLFESHDQVLIQDTVAGHGVGIELLVHEGHILLAFQHRRLHESTGFGSSYRESVSLDPDLFEASEKLVKVLNYTGVVMIEFKVDEETGDWHFIEINARFWGSLPLAVAAGADFPFSLYELLVNDKRDFERQYRLGIRCRYLSADIRWMRSSLRKKPVDRWRGMDVNCVSKWRLLADVGRIIFLRDRLDTFAVDDPRPAFYEMGRLIATAAQNLRRRLST